MRARALMLGLIATLVAATASVAQNAALTAADTARLTLSQATAQDRVLGRADAPVTLVEYASFTCPHCAIWHQEVLPLLKARFIATGQVKLVFRDLPTQPRALSLPAAALARCAAPDSFFAVADALMSGQATLRAGGDPNVWAGAAVAKAGRPTSEVSACMDDPATRATLEAGIETARLAGVTGTPMFLLNGQLLRDGSIEGLTAAITPLLPPASAP